MTLPLLRMLAPAPVEVLPGGRLRLDAKFVEGMRLHQALWDGPVEVILWQGGAIPFGIELAREDLGFGLRILPAGAALTENDLRGAAVISASADQHLTLGLAPLAQAVGARLVYVVEYTLGTRLRILWLEAGQSLPRRLRSTLWTLQQERRRRAAIRSAGVIQANGYPAARAYGRLVPDCLTYLDGRMRAGMMADATAMAARAQYLRGGGPLRIVHSGRLERLKGAQDLLPVALALRAAGVSFTLDIYGAGAEGGAIAAGIVAQGLGRQVRLHDPLPFDTGLVPHLIRDADLFLSCHRQADPSCTYLESMGCGLAVIGYDNDMWRALAAQSGGGWVTPMGQTGAIASGIAALDADRAVLIAAGQAALEFASAHSFEAEFARRMAHLAQQTEPSGL